MAKDYISLQEAADLSNKSIQTIRRAIKSKKLLVRRKNTPQGFNYMVNKESLAEFYGLRLIEEKSEKVEKTEVRKQEKIVTEQLPGNGTMIVEVDDFKALVKTLDGLVQRHSDERQNFLRLVDSLNERIFVLENQINLLKAPQVDAKWYEFWK